MIRSRQGLRAGGDAWGWGLRWMGLVVVGGEGWDGVV